MMEQPTDYELPRAERREYEDDGAACLITVAVLSVVSGAFGLLIGWVVFG